MDINSFGEKLPLEAWEFDEPLLGKPGELDPPPFPVTCKNCEGSMKLGMKLLLFVVFWNDGFMNCWG